MRLSDGGKIEKPQQAPTAKPTPQREAPTAGVGGVAAGSGMEGVLAQRADAVDQVRYRMTGGASGTAPAGHLAAERRNIVGAAASRIMRKASGGASTAGTQIPKGAGAPLPGDVKSRMEPKLGADLSGVRVHTGGESAKAAAGFGARAFTVGSDVHFNSGQYAPGTKEGDKLLAHELTHVVQGQNAGVQRKADDDHAEAKEGAAGGEHEVSDPNEAAEKEADAKSEEVAGALHDDKDKKGGADKKDKKGDKDKGGEAKAAGDEKAADGKPEEKPAPIAAKLEGVGRKVFLSGTGPQGGGNANANANAQSNELKSPSGKPAKEGTLASGGAPALQLYGYGGVRKVDGKLVKDIEKELKALDEKAEKAAKTGGPKLTAEEEKQQKSHKAILDDVNKTKGEDYLIFAGHIGVSIDNGATIYGFTPVAPEGMPKEQVISHLHNHTMTFPGAVKNDKAHFDLAERCAKQKKWDTDVTSVTRTLTTAAHAETKKKLQDLAGQQPGAHGLYYSFPLSDAVDGQYFVDTPGPDGKIVKGQNQANCATFPGKIGIELPEESGNLRFFMPKLREEAAKQK